MCEWLSSDDWSDVQLLCDGRTFSAHRAVLASVSSFLREVLLSCPEKDSPAFIILPDFDLGAVSCVLHYIYHGEVVIPECSMKLFLDIVETMQIYVDPQYLSPTSETIENLSLGYKTQCVGNSSNINSSSHNDRSDLGKVTRDRLKNILHKVQRPSVQSFRALDFRNVQIKRNSPSAKFSLSTEDKKSRCEDRQKISDIRDLFIETYAKNSNSNGASAGVLAISNERYHGRTSVLFTNANGRHPSADDTLSKPSQISSKCRSYLTPQSKSLQAYDSFYVSSKNNCTEKVLELANNNKIGINFLLDTNGKMNYWKEDLNEPINFKKSNSFIDEYSTLDLRTTASKSKSIEYKIVKDNLNYENCKRERDSDKKVMQRNATTPSKIYSKARNAMNKGIILNQVLRNPWCPLPNYYKPFRRKSTLADFAKRQSKLDSDGNNNINLLKEPLNKIQSEENISKSELKDAIVPSHSLHPSDENVLKCTPCNQIFSNNESFKRHMRRHSTVTYSCGECCKTFSQLRNYRYHMSVHRGTKEFATTCPVCGKYFNDRGYLSSHMKIHRNRKEYKCSMCPKSFNQRVAYNMHFRIHTGLKPHVCDECGKAFSRKMLLKQHQRTHSGERPYACSHCDKRFADRSNMILHLRLHTGVKPFSCSICSKSFTKKHHLKSHLNYHTGAKPYSCPTCNLAFSQSSNMRTHFKKCNVAEASPSKVETIKFE